MASAAGSSAPVPLQRMEIHIPKRVYWGGDVVYGAVEINTAQELKSYGVILEFEGYERGMYLAEPSLKFRYARNTFIHRLSALSGMPFEKQISSTPEGRSVFPFAFKLPDVLPPSISQPEMKDCYVKYSIAAYLVRPEDNVKEKPGDLLKDLVDLDIGGSLQDQMAFSQPHPVTKTESAKFIMSGKMKATVTLDNDNIFTDETINVMLDIDNDSGKKVQAVIVELVCTYEFKGVARSGSGDGTKKSKITFESWRYNVEIPEKTHKQVPLRVRIQNDAPTLSGIKSVFTPAILRVSHKLTVRLDLPWATDITVKFPVILQRRNNALSSVSVPSNNGLEGVATGKVMRKAGTEGRWIPTGERSTVEWNPKDPAPLIPSIPYYEYPSGVVPMPLTLGRDLNPDALYAVGSVLFGSYSLAI